MLPPLELALLQPPSPAELPDRQPAPRCLAQRLLPIARLLRVTLADIHSTPPPSRWRALHTRDLHPIGDYRAGLTAREDGFAGRIRRCESDIMTCQQRARPRGPGIGSVLTCLPILVLLLLLIVPIFGFGVKTPWVHVPSIRGIGDVPKEGKPRPTVFSKNVTVLYYPVNVEEAASIFDVLQVLNRDKNGGFPRPVCRQNLI
jgi:hypothetical protein